MRRWTLLVVPHDSSAPRSFSITERGLRLAAGAALGVVLIFLIGIGTVIARLGSLPAEGPRMAQADAMVPAVPAPEIAALRENLEGLRGVMDTIRAEERRLRATVGDPGMEQRTIASRFLGFVPRIFRERKLKPQVARDSTEVRVLADAANRSVDSLAEHAMALAARYRKVGPAGGTSIDGVPRAWLRPESVSVALRRGGAVARRAGKSLEWKASHPVVALSGIDGRVRAVAWTGDGWRIEITGTAGLEAQLSGAGDALVRVGDPVGMDAPLLRAPAYDPDKPVLAWSVKRNGVVLDATRAR